jgi:HD-like signal output (HDOD) protein
MKCVGATHQCYSKPFDPAVLRDAIQRICALQATLNNEAVRALVNRLPCLPSMPDVFVQLMDALQSPHCSVEDVGKIVGRDPAVTAKLLQLVNSAFFGFARDVTEVSEAVQLLGISLVRALALTVRLFSAFNGRTYRECSVEQVWLQSLRAGWLARQILKQADCPEEVVEQGFTAGLLHDVGMLALVAQLTGPYQEVLATARLNHRPLREVELEALGATHAQVGAYMLGLWGLPCGLVEAVAYHHAPEQSPDTTFGPLAAVHVASVLAGQGAAKEGECRMKEELDLAYLEKLGVADRVDEWKALANQVA